MSDLVGKNEDRFCRDVAHMWFKELKIIGISHCLDLKFIPLVFLGSLACI